MREKKQMVKFPTAAKLSSSSCNKKTSCARKIYATPDVHYEHVRLTLHSLLAKDRRSRRRTLMSTTLTVDLIEARIRTAHRYR